MVRELTLTENQLSEILKESFLTGSRRWRVHNNDSDWDYVVKQMNAEKVLGGNFKCCGFYTTIDNKRYNLIVKDSKQFESWKSTTELLEQYVGNLGTDIIKNRSARICIFTMLRATALTLDDYLKEDNGYVR